MIDKNPRMMKSSPIKAAMAASLAADDDEEGSLTRFTRSRVLTDVVDDQQL